MAKKGCETIFPLRDPKTLSRSSEIQARQIKRAAHARLRKGLINPDLFVATCAAMEAYRPKEKTSSLL